MQWASLSDVPQMDTSPKFGTEQGFNILNTILISSPKISVRDHRTAIVLTSYLHTASPASQ